MTQERICQKVSELKTQSSDHRIIIVIGNQFRIKTLNRRRWEESFWFRVWMQCNEHIR